MKKQSLTALICTAAMIFSLTACSGTSTTSSSESTSAPEPADSSAAEGSSEAASGYVPEGDFNIRVFAGAGGIADTVTRMAAQGLQEEYGVTAIVNNLTGANGAVAAADMDAYPPSINELSVVSMSLFTMAPLMNKDLNVSLDNYEIVGSLIRDEFVLLVSAKSGIKSWDDLVNYAASNQIIYASNAPGGNTHILQTALFGDAGLDAQAVTSDASNKDILAVVSGDAICTSATISLAKTYVESGDVIPIAVFSDNTYTGFDGFEVPAVKSFGYDISLPSYNFIITRAGVDKAQIKGLYDAMLAWRETDTFKQQAEAAHYTPDATNGEDLRAEIEHYAQVCKEIYDKYYQ